MFLKKSCENRFGVSYCKFRLHFSGVNYSRGIDTGENTKGFYLFSEMISQEVLDLLSPGQTVRSQATFACAFGLFWWLIFRLRHPIARYVQKQPCAHRVILVEKKKMSNLGVTLQRDYRALESYVTNI